jgi:DNA helicase-2/ATP-dependent DNA helicase PcrA
LSDGRATAQDVLAEETTHLATTLRRLERVIAAAEDSLERREADYQQVKRYMVEHRAEIDPTEMFQNELLLRNTDSQGNHAMRYRDRLAALRPSPYFGRVDFRPAGEGAGGAATEPSDAAGDLQVAYIGRHSFRDEKGIAVLDWRSPYAGMFYDGDRGPAGYDSPAGRVTGTVERKRQITVTAGALRLAVDTDQTVRDEVLQRELGRSADPAMRSIIATIQREQNEAIRNETDHTLIIQGVAGSGKTSIALHRIAYLLYRQRRTLAADRMAILSPHSVFGDYIGQVLPELGEEPIATLSAAGIAAAHLGSVGFARERDLLDDDGAALERARAKSSAESHRLLEETTMRLVEECFRPVDCTVAGHRLAGEWLAARYAALAPRPITQRLAQITADVVDRLCSRAFGPPPPRPGDVKRRLGAMLSVKSPMALYRQVCRELSGDSRASRLLVPAAKGTLEWADVFPYLYVRSRFDGLAVQDGVRHLVIDEMQDYTPTQLAVIRALYPCPMTVLGDVGQSVSPARRSTLSDVTDALGPARVVELHRSYRSTAPIMAFASAIRGGEPIDTVDRGGPEPEVIACVDRDEQVRVVGERIRRHLGGAGGGTMAVIARSSCQARLWHEALVEDWPVTLVDDGGPGLRAGVCVLSVRMAKGLEFGDVVVVDASAEMYATDLDRSLLYVACTRALHRLAVTWVGAGSGHVPGH